jgi:hypothetical protein
MKSILILILIAFATGCSSSSNSSGGSGTSMQGTWTVTGSFSQQRGPTPQSSSGPYQVELVSSPCSVITPVGTFSVEGTVCFIANNNSGQGSISGPGIAAKSTGQGVLIGVPSNPLPSGGTFNLLFIDADQSLNFIEFTGSGTVSNGMMKGSGSCSSSTPMCQGATGTFSGSPQ